MDLGEKMNLFMRMDALIRRKSTGSPESFARMLGVSERTLYGYLKKLKELGGPIYYNSARNSYCYEYDVVFSIGFLPKENSMLELRGGNNSNLFQQSSALQNFCSEALYI
ncbi:MAG: helix-turn-helix domain-containing protein [Saprospiraceae bacterium]|nr:helix-turn-helix domain-containing protein [Saprospiraceae bacterium]